MKEINLCGYTRSTFMFGDDILYLIKYDDGRFEYRGLITVPANAGSVDIPHPMSIAAAASAIGTNYYSNDNVIFISATCNNAFTRIDCVSPTTGIPKKSCGVNVFVQGFWK